jgi:hypothetical protein
MVIPHHQGAIEMAQAELRGVAAAQTIELLMVYARTALQQRHARNGTPGDPGGSQARGARNHHSAGGDGTGPGIGFGGWAAGAKRDLAGISDGAGPVLAAM